MRHSFGIPSKPQAFPNSKDCISFETSQGQKFAGVSSSAVASKPWTLASTVTYGHSHIIHTVLIGFLNNQQLWWLYRVDEIWGLKDHEL
jgi:hypothetical protein